MALIATPAAPNANSYATVAESDTYHATRLYSDTWIDSDVVTQETSLIMATRLLDTMYQWANFVTTLTQALQWPRVGMFKRNRLDYVDDMEIPPELKNATSEFARQLIEADRTPDSDVQTQGIRSLTAGPVTIDFASTVIPKVVPDAVYNLLPPWWGSVVGRDSRIREVVRY